MADIQPRPGFAEFFAIIQKLGYPTSIGSLTEEKWARLIIQKSGLDKLFDPKTIVLKEDVPNLKPAPDVFLETARRMGINPRNQLVFEDSPNGVKAAIAAGSQAIGMPVYDLPQAIDPLIRNGAMKVFLDWYKIDPEKLIQEINR